MMSGVESKVASSFEGMGISKNGGKQVWREGITKKSENVWCG